MDKYNVLFFLYFNLFAIIYFIFKIQLLYEALYYILATNFTLITMMSYKYKRKISLGKNVLDAPKTD